MPLHSLSSRSERVRNLRRSALPLRLLAGGVSALLLSSCKAAPLAYGTDPASAKANADAVFSALEHRYTKVVRDPKFSNARMRIARYALTPSKIENDTSVWTGKSGSSGLTRELVVDGSMRNNQYTFVASQNAPFPQRTGDSRHVMRLSPLAEDQYQWATDVDHNVGKMAPARAGAVFTAWFASAERLPSTIRADYRSTFPRTMQSVGRLFVLDSVLTSPQSDGSTLVHMRVFMDANRLRASNPSMAKYVDKYVSSSKYQIRLTDQSGTEWFSANAERGDRVMLTFRSKNGVLQPITGNARAMPDTLRITVSAMAKIGMFSVGVSDMQGMFVQIKSATDRGWLMRFQKEPEWHLPLAGRQLLRSPLRRPFEGSGVLFRIGFRSGPGAQTVLYRKFDLAVQESTVMRFIGSLGFTAMSDYAGGVEAEENRFLQEMFAAMRADVSAISPG